MPSVAAPSLKVMVPVGVPAPGPFAVTVAVSVTDWPAKAGFNDELRPTVVVSWLTVVAPAAKLPRKVVFPPYVAVMLWRPADRLEIDRVALPPLRVPVP